MLEIHQHISRKANLLKICGDDCFKVGLMILNWNHFNFIIGHLKTSSVM